MPTDAELLHRYASEKAQDAFAEFVRRNLGLVYSAALRRTGGRSQLAEEVAQKVFCDVSRKALALARHPSLAGWLHQSTRFAAIDALRAEWRQHSIANSVAAMHEHSAAPDTPPDWEKLRPILDEVLDTLGERDRDLLLMRHFQGLSHVQVAQRTGVSDNAARKRCDRALDKLRAALNRRGIHSTSAALGLLLTGLPLSAAPVGLSARIANLALATPPATGLSGLFVLITMNKLTTPILSAVLSTGLTSAVWSATHQDLSKDIQTQRDEYAQLKAATAADASPEGIAKIASDYERNAASIAAALPRQRHASSPTLATTPQPAKETSAHGYTDLGRSTALNAVMSFAWACDVCDPDVLGSLVYLDETTLAHAKKVLASMPESVRAQYPSPEAFYGFLLAAACIEAPPPNAELAKRMLTVVSLAEDRVASRRLGSDQNMHEFQHTADGWKYVLPDIAIDSLPSLLNSQTLAKLSQKK